MKRILALSLLAACSTSTTGDDTTGGPGDVVGTQQDPVAAKSGPYAMVNRIDFTVEAILPGQIEAVVASLREMSTNPAHALVDLADQAGVPAVGTLYGLLPGVLTDKLEGWINAEIAKVMIGGHPVTDYCGDIAALADTALSHFAADSSLTLADDGSVTHVITALDLTPSGLDFKLPIGGLAADILTQHPTLTVGAAGALQLGDQRFGLEYGEYAWQGVNAISTQLFGHDVRTTLGDAIDCPSIAQKVASKCVLGVCVGHADLLTSICVGGLDAAVNAVHDKLDAYNITALHFAAGSATLADDDGDGVGDRITGGTWDAEMNLGLGLRHTPATFTGTR